MSPSATIGDLWRASTRTTGIFLQKKDVSNRVLDFSAHINYPVPENEDNDDEDVYTVWHIF